MSEPAVTPPRPVDPQGNLDPRKAIYLLVSMTKRCNMRCPGCYLLQQDEDFFQDQDIEWDSARRIVSYYRAAGVRQAIPNAEGEVLLHGDYPALVAYINRQGFRYKPWLVTNGIRLPPLADFVARNIGEVLISIDGPDHRRYNAFRGGNQALFDKVLAGVRALVTAVSGLRPRPEIIVNCVMTAGRSGDIPDMIRLAEQVGADTIKFTNFHVVAEGDQHRPVSRTDPATRAVLRQIVARRDHGVNVFLPSFYEDIASPYDCKMLYSIVVGSNGDYSPCCRVVPDAKWGNFYSSPEKHNNRALREFRVAVTSASRRDELPAVCRQCAHLSPQRLVFSRQSRRWYRTRRS